MNARKFRALFIVAWLAMVLTAIGGGCQRERIVDVKTPVGNATVDKDKNTGDVGVKVDVKEERRDR